MRSSGSRISQYQLCALFSFVFSIVYYLIVHINVCGPLPEAGVLGLDPVPNRYHVLVTGGAGYIGSHAVKKLLSDGHAVTVVDNLSRGNKGAIDALQHMAVPGRLQFIEADLGDLQHIRQILRRNSVNLVMHFAAVAYVGTAIAPCFPWSVLVGMESHFSYPYYKLCRRVGCRPIAILPQHYCKHGHPSHRDEGSGHKESTCLQPSVTCVVVAMLSVWKKAQKSLIVSSFSDY